MEGAGAASGEQRGAGGEAEGARGEGTASTPPSPPPPPPRRDLRASPTHSKWPRRPPRHTALTSQRQHLRPLASSVGAATNTRTTSPSSAAQAHARTHEARTPHGLSDTSPTTAQGKGKGTDTHSLTLARARLPGARRPQQQLAGHESTSAGAPRRRDTFDTSGG